MIESILNETKKIFIFGKDIHSKYLFCNETTAEAAGFDSPAQIVGKTDADLFWSKYANLYRSYEESVLRGNTFMNVQAPVTVAQKNITTILSCQTILFGKNGHPAGITGHCIDIT